MFLMFLIPGALAQGSQASGGLMVLMFFVFKCLFQLKTLIPQGFWGINVFNVFKYLFQLKTLIPQGFWGINVFNVFKYLFQLKTLIPQGFWGLMFLFF